MKISFNFNEFYDCGFDFDENVCNNRFELMVI